MKVINKSDNLYEKIVKVYDNDNYNINVEVIPDDTSVECPFDNTMKVSKKDGKILVSKKSKIFPFLQKN